MDIIGYLLLVIGPMFSGKSTELCRLYRMYSLKHKVLVLNHSIDTRYGTGVVSTHNKEQIQATCVDELFPVTVSEAYAESKVILVDESQFFSDLIEFTEQALKDNKIIVIFGLSGDSKQEKFGHILDLIPKADDVTFLKAVCNYCPTAEQNAPFSKRLDDTNGGRQVQVGSSEYVPTCRKHHD